MKIYVSASSITRKYKSKVVQGMGSFREHPNGVRVLQSKTSSDTAVLPVPIFKLFSFNVALM